MNEIIHSVGAGFLGHIEGVKTREKNSFGCVSTRLKHGGPSPTEKCLIMGTRVVGFLGL